jgi:RNA polymerase primary sigma factor
MSGSTTVNKFFVEARDRRLLPPDEELILARQAQSGCESSMRDLIESNLGFVVKVALEYRNAGMPIEDLFAEGSLGLIQAVKHFDPDKGNRFITYAVWWIRKSILMALSNSSRLVKVPAYRQKRIRELRDVERQLSNRLGRKPTRSEIKERFSARRSTVDKLMQLDYRETSIDAPVNSQSDMRLSDKLADSRESSPEDFFLRHEGQTLLREAVAELSDRERDIITYRFGLADEPPLTLTEIGDQLGLSRERVRQLEQEIKKRLRRYLSRRHAPRNIYSAEKGSCRSEERAV